MRSAELDSDVMAFYAERGRRTAEEFGKECGEPPLLEFGETIQYQTITRDGRPRIILGREGADWWRIRYQLAHEVFHWICTPPGTFHWTHELLAVETAVRAMEEIGEHDYAQREMARLDAEAERISVAEMLVTRLGTASYPEGLYGRAWRTGRQLSDAVGTERVKQLADSFDPEGNVDVGAWMRSLHGDDRAKVEAILGAPSPAWV